LRRVEFELMRPAEIVAAKRELPLAFVPVGPIEWHGPHLPVGTDGLHAWHVAVRVAREVGGVVLPPLFAGTDLVRLPGGGPEQLGALGLDDGDRVVGMDFPDFPVRSVYYEESVFGLTVREVVRALKRNSYRLVVLANGHGAQNQQRTLARVALEESEPEVRVVFTSVWAPPEPPQIDPGHADRGETAVMLALLGDRVRPDELPDEGPLAYRDYGVVDGRAFDGDPTSDFTLRPESDPRGVAAEEGERLLEREVRFVAERVRAELEQLAFSFS